MQAVQRKRWWLAGVGWTLAAAFLALVAGGVVPFIAHTSEAPLLEAMSTHAGYLYAVAGLMTLMGWIDSILLYRRGGEPLLGRSRA
ncbi:hypothetical protein IMZ29_06470 [Achromobacter sp. GG226]|uniref:hypothetical protein n=1 Tax=Verticiella alkaliphila TaxID=2779529 RepID=UPI001C0B8B38|nr:hypothetical protein [Verticiella sp. GG226]MBU4610192.1 hypothetical protein [Verticiella sp. GG226]